MESDQPATRASPPDQPFFHSGEKTITGNNRLNLECTNSTLFPPEWLNKFQDSTGTQFDLFNPSIKDKLVDDISIGEKLIHAFQELTHSKKEKSGSTTCSIRTIIWNSN